MFYNFKKGELVPCWIERGENIKEIRFGVDVLVYDTGESIQVYPYENSYEYIMKVKPIDNSQKVHVIGAPTEIYNDISVFFTNVEDKTKQQIDWMWVMRYVKVKQNDYIAWYLIFKKTGIKISWATLPNDPWRDDDNNPKWFGFMKEIGQIAIGYNFIIGRLKIGTALHKK